MPCIPLNPHDNLLGMSKIILLGMSGWLIVFGITASDKTVTSLVSIKIKKQQQEC